MLHHCDHVRGNLVKAVQLPGKKLLDLKLTDQGLCSGLTKELAYCDAMTLMFGGV